MAWQRKARGRAIALAVWLGVGGVQALAETPAERVKALQADPGRWQAAIDAGRRTAEFCANCHGDKGYSKSPEVPNLGGQNPAYLLEQIRKFGAGERKDQFMQGLIKALKDEERLQLAAYYASLDVPAGKADAVLAPRGKDLFVRLCARCHGEAAHGSETIPRLAGQQGEYLKKTITRYRDGTGERIYTLMQVATGGLKNEDITALAAYLTALK